MRSSVASLVLLALALPALGSPARGQEEASAATRPAPPYERIGPFYPGLASVPWHAAWSPDGRFVAFVEGWVHPFIAVHDAETHALVWKTTPATQPASHRPVFTRDGNRLILVEGRDLVVRERSESDWPPVRRVPLGFKPGITLRPRPISLSRDERWAVLCDDGRAYRVPLTGPTGTAVELGVADAAVAHFFADGRLAVARWSDEVAETVFVGEDLKKRSTLPFAVLAASADGRTWLGADPQARAESGELVLHLVDAESRERLGSVPVQRDAVRRWTFLAMATFSPDGRFLATVESLRTAAIRDARTGRLRQRIREYDGDRLIGLAFSPDGRYLVTGGRRGTRQDDQRSVLLWRRRPEGRGPTKPR